MEHTATFTFKRNLDYSCWVVIEGPVSYEFGKRFFHFILLLKDIKLKEESKEENNPLCNDYGAFSNLAYMSCFI